MVSKSEKIATNLRKGVLEYCVLALVGRGESYGFDLAKRLSASGLIASEGTLYPLLARMHDAGLLSSEWRESDAGRPRRYYRITKFGREQLDAFQAVWIPVRDAVDELLEELP